MRNRKNRMTTKLLEFVPKGQRKVAAECGKLPPGAEAAGTDAFEHRITTSPLRNEHSAVTSSDQRPWKVRFLIFAGLLCFVWYQVAKQLGWLN